MSDVLKYLSSEKVIENLQKLRDDLIGTDKPEAHQKLLADKFIDLFELRHQTSANQALLALAEKMFSHKRAANRHRLENPALETESDGFWADFRLLWEMKFGKDESTGEVVEIPSEVLQYLGLEPPPEARRPKTLYEQFDEEYQRADTEVVLYSDGDLSEWRKTLSENLLGLDETTSKRAVLELLPQLEELESKVNKIAAVEDDANRRDLAVDLEATEENKRLKNIIAKLKANCPALEE